MNPDTELIAAKTISGYLGKKLAFDAATSEAQETLESVGWEWVKKDISGYGRSGDYQYWLVSPEMFEALTLVEDIENDTPEIEEEPDYEIWKENVHYILF